MVYSTTLLAFVTSTVRLPGCCRWRVYWQANKITANKASPGIKWGRRDGGCGGRGGG